MEKPKRRKNHRPMAKPRQFLTWLDHARLQGVQKVLTDPRLTPAEKATWMFFHEFEGVTSTDLQHYLSISENSAQKYVKTLVDLGYLAQEQMRERHGAFRWRITVQDAAMVKPAVVSIPDDVDPLELMTGPIRVVR